MTETYESWTNRETWAVALHINNDQAWQEAVREALTELTDDDGESLIVKVSWTAEQAHRAGETIRESVETVLSLDHCFTGHNTLNAETVKAVMSVRDDIGSLWRVDWDALGASFLQDVAQS